MGKRWLENKGRFHLTGKIRLSVAAGLFFLTLPLHAYYQQVEVVAARNKELIRLTQIKFTADSLLSENKRRDSLHFYISKLRQLEPESAFNSLKDIEKFCADAREMDTLKQLKKSVSRRHASSLISRQKGKQALFVYEKLLSDFPNDANVLYDRANYYVKAGNVKAAVADLTSAINRGSTLASKLYNKVNPMRRRVSYYVTRCCDGTTSNAKGRGACSWHGGVCNWNEPVYEEYRKY
ncbi:tetratricopeptide repeat protein [Pedobacter nyackensis]|nr:tetratricopeptide repeat protein [Pedobacter nyackensis]